RPPFIERPVSAHRAERRFANAVRTGGLLPFPRTGCVLVRDASVIRSFQQVKKGVLSSDMSIAGNVSTANGVVQAGRKLTAIGSSTILARLATRHTSGLFGRGSRPG